MSTIETMQQNAIGVALAERDQMNQNLAEMAITEHIPRQNVRDCVAEYSRLYQRFESITRDAARYRWLRDTQNTECRDCGDDDRPGVIENIFVCEGGGKASAPHATELDAAIDAAMGMK